MAASDDDNEFSYSFQTDDEYSGPCIAKEPRASPVEVDQVPTARPVSSSPLSSGLSYPVVQPLVSANRVSEKPHEASTSLVLRSHHVVSGSSSERLDVAEEANSSVDLQLSPSPSSLEVREDTLDDYSIAVEVDEGNGNRVVPSHGSESDESSYMSEEEDSVAARSRAERRGKRGSCYRCLKGNRFTEKEVCIVCDAKYCSSCVRRAMGSMPEGRKCLTCIGLRISESNRESLGKCSRMLKRLLSDSELRQVMHDEVMCKVNQLCARLIYVNGMPLSEDELVMLQTCPSPPKNLKPGDYWYDKIAGYWGKLGEKPCQIISPHMNIGDSDIMEQASHGDTEIFINNREITKTELMMLKMVGVQCEGKPNFWFNADGTYQKEGQNCILGNIWNKTIARLACAVLSLPFPPCNSYAIESSYEPTYNPIMLLIGNEKCGATTINKQARLLYEVPFTKDVREKIKVIIQTNIYAYLAMVLEAHEEEMNNNLFSDQTGNTGDESVSFISPRLQHFSDWLLREKEEGNLKIFPASSREDAKTVADLWRVPAIQDTYKRLRETLPRNAAYFLGRILEILRSEYEPSDMDILKAEGLSSVEGISCVEFSFPSTTQKGSLEDHDYHNPDMKYQIIRLKPRSLGENWKWLEMFEDADLVIFCVSLTDYGEYIEDVDGVLVNKMVANKQLFESMVTHPTLANKRFLLLLTKFDLLEEKIEEVPLRTCEWFEDFNPLISQSQTSEHNHPMAQRAFDYVVFQFKRLYDSLSIRRRKFKPKLFVSQVSLESDSVDNALRYARKILKRHVGKKHPFSK